MARAKRALSHLEVRRIRRDEIDETGRMWQRSQRAAYTWFRPEQFHPLEDALAYFRNTICEGRNVWVARYQGEVVGVLALDGEFLDHLFVDPDHQGRGIGSRLLEKAMSLNPERLKLVTLQRNQRARRFYEKRGFVVTKRGTSPPPESEPDIWYEWHADP
jgi:GNAT superfamily N-acetyltransferase